jgi:hypothetical protein
MRCYEEGPDDRERQELWRGEGRRGEGEDSEVGEKKGMKRLRRGVEGVRGEEGIRRGRDDVMKYPREGPRMVDDQTSS